MNNSLSILQSDNGGTPRTSFRRTHSSSDLTKPLNGSGAGNNSGGLQRSVTVDSEDEREELLLAMHRGGKVG